LRHPTAQSGARGIIVKHDFWHGVSLFSYLSGSFLKKGAAPAEPKNFCS
jgi:hypothetical protein